ncbi:hypothetical protein ABEB36_004263 [Hypothenemus hampei]|uniref:Uncharacterized protein n=1 Tax=Hypothenemus hampei TaxID=57062 RepID=A0ABD1F2T7_HYPHA
MENTTDSGLKVFNRNSHSNKVPDLLPAMSSSQSSCTSSWILENISILNKKQKNLENRLQSGNEILKRKNLEQNFVEKKQKLKFFADVVQEIINHQDNEVLNDRQIQTIQFIVNQLKEGDDLT